MNPSDLLAELAAAPNLPRARCAGRHRLFDSCIEGDRTGPRGAAELAEHRDAALRVCQACPELAACGAWFTTLPRSRRPLGVVAGRVNDPKARPGHQERNTA